MTGESEAADGGFALDLGSLSRAYRQLCCIRYVLQSAQDNQVQTTLHGGGWGSTNQDLMTKMYTCNIIIDLCITAGSARIREIGLLKM